ncbi:ribbon-helix-helix domain-containing protein [Microvirga sp. 2MCAF38]|uniref:ribbon-helix-helix domain-containing protein n=1 Tax=Microvirga sp. 2MCAF38 TaxID=3232989 RepID=UPI003F9D1C0A
MSGSGVIKRSLSIAGHRTSVSLEEQFWDALREIAEKRSLSIQALVQGIDTGRGDQNLSSAIRVFVLNTLREDLNRRDPAPSAEL